MFNKTKNIFEIFQRAQDQLRSLEKIETWLDVFVELFLTIHQAECKELYRFLGSALWRTQQKHWQWSGKDDKKVRGYFKIVESLETDTYR